MHRTVVSFLALTIGFTASLPRATATEPTFSHDVATIIQRKCTICHRPDSSGPFSLITFGDVQRRSATIEAVLDDNYMPPWKPIDHGIEFANARSLTIQEKHTVKAWIAAGCPEGDVSQAPAPPTFADGWTLGKPDMVVTMNGTFDVPADGPDIYRSFVFPLNLPDDKWVKAVELRPRAKSSVHHAIFFLDTTRNARTLDGADGKTGISGMGFLANFGDETEISDSALDSPSSGRSTIFDRLRQAAKEREPEEERQYRVNSAFSRGLGGYVPGAMPNLLPGDLAMALPRGSDIVMQTHFHPSGKREVEQADIALYFSDQPPSRHLVPIMLPSMFGFGANIKIPAGDKDFRISDSITLPVDTQAIGVSGHAHYVCREMKLTATIPHGETKILLHIDDWDLDWQDQYLFAEPVDLPAGTVLNCEIAYDNSADNPENPHHPPREIRWGRGSNDEMGSVTLLTVVKQVDDEAALQATIRRHFMETLVYRKSPELARMLMQLDDDDDGKLTPSEAPPRFSAQMFQFIDADKDGALDVAELERALDLRDRFRAGGKEADLAKVMLRLLDANNDQQLQLSEAPPQFSQVYRFVDANQDGGLDAAELERALKLRNQLRGAGAQ